MKDLFTLQDDEGNDSTETSNIFSQLSEDVNIGVPNDGQQDQAHIASALPSTSEAEPSNVGEGRVDVNSDQADEESNILKSLFDAQGIHVSSIFSSLTKLLCAMLQFSELTSCFLNSVRVLSIMMP